MNKKILICTGIFPPDVGGPATQSMNVCKILQSKKIDFCVLTYSKKQNIQNLEKFKVIKVSNNNFFLINYLKYFFKVLKYAKKYDIIYLQGAFSEGIPTILANFFLRKILYFSKVNGKNAKNGKFPGKCISFPRLSREKN